MLPCNNSSKSKINTRFYSKANSELHLLVRHQRKDSQASSHKEAYSQDNSPSNSSLNRVLIHSRPEDSTLLQIPHSIQLEVVILEVSSNLRHKAIPLVKVDLVLYQATNLRIRLQHFSAQVQIKIPSSHNSRLVVYSVHHSSNNHLKVVEASSSLSSLDSKIQLSLEAAMVGCSGHLLAVLLTPRHRYSVQNLELQHKALVASSSLQAHRQMLVAVSSIRLQNQQVLNLVGFSKHQLQTRHQTKEASSDHQQVEEIQESLTN